MAFSEIEPVREYKCAYIPCKESIATHWQIEIGAEGKDGLLVLPSKELAEACMKRFVIPMEVGEFD
jgi:hypothetical protein